MSAPWLAVITSPDVAGLDRAVLREIVTDMGREPGWCPSGDLYRWYVGMAEEAMLQPLSQNAFGRALTSLGYRRSMRRFEGRMTRCLFLTARTFRAS